MRELEGITKLLDFLSKPEWNDLHVMVIMVISSMLEDLESLEVWCFFFIIFIALSVIQAISWWNTVVQMNMISMCWEKSIIMHCTLSLRGFCSVTFKTVTVLIWLMMAFSCPFKEEHLALQLSMPVSTRRSMVWCSWLCASADYNLTKWLRFLCMYCRMRNLQGFCQYTKSVVRIVVLIVKTTT